MEIPEKDPHKANILNCLTKVQRLFNGERTDFNTSCWNTKMFLCKKKKENLYIHHTSHISDKGLVSRTQKEFLKVNNKKTQFKNGQRP